MSGKHIELLPHDDTGPRPHAPPGLAFWPLAVSRTLSSCLNPPVTIAVTPDWGDCDPAGVVFYPRFFAWMDRAAHELFRAVGIAPSEFVAPQQRGFPIADIRCRFAVPVRFGDALHVRLRVARIGDSSLELDYTITRPHDGVTVATGHEVRVHLAPAGDGTLRPAAIAGALRARLEAFVASQEPVR